jgi:hypothetical protein
MWRDALRGVRAGVRQHEFIVQAGDGGDPVSLRIAAPAVDDLALEPLAATARVAIGVRRRFPVALESLALITFDHSSRELTDHAHAGEAQGSLSTIHLNASYVIESALGQLGQFSVEVVTAHELGHLVDAWMQARDYRRSIELRREIGKHFGLETLEHVIRGDRPGATAQFVAEVSLYGTKNTMEAFAELFMLWWMRPPEPSPAVALFGELMDRYFPAPPSEEQG